MFDELGQTLSKFRGRVYAVVDGAQFDDIHFELNRAGLSFRPLYLRDRETTKPAMGPQMVSPHNSHELDALCAIVADKPAAVWWDWPDNEFDSEQQLYKHLRRLGMAEIPSDKLPPGKKRPEYSPVLFRHADPRVMHITLPVLTLEQWGQLFGDAYGLAYAAAESGVKYAPRPPELDAAV